MDASSGSWIGAGTTDSLGAYSISLSPGTYKLLVQTNSASYPSYMWDGSGGATLSVTFASATPVSLPPNATVNITVYAASYTLSGSVIQAGGLGPLVGAVVNVMDASSGSWIGAGTTDSLGAYSISLSPGTYKLPRPDQLGELSLLHVGRLRRCDLERDLRERHACQPPPPMPPSTSRSRAPDLGLGAPPLEAATCGRCAPRETRPLPVTVRS